MITRRSTATQVRSLILAHLVGTAALAALPAPALASGTGNSIACAEYSAHYVARVIFEKRLESGNWQETHRDTMMLGSRSACVRWSESYPVRITVEGFTGFVWRQVCRPVFYPGSSGVVTITGTALNQGCQRW
jgi:hypothetical protein